MIKRVVQKRRDKEKGQRVINSILELKYLKITTGNFVLKFEAAYSAYKK